jgi:alcohol dehydrogenase class IV
MQSWQFATAGEIRFGAGAARDLPAAVRALGERPLLVTGRSPSLAGQLLGPFDCVTVRVAREPGVELVREGARLAEAAGCDVVVAIGGGSAIDAGKAIAALAANGGDVLDYLEVIGAGRSLESPSLPFVAVPTTAGTGSEVTRNAVLASREHRVKASMRSPFMLPRVALVDPELTYDLPPEITAATGMDALTQLIEPYVSPRANPLTDALCVEGIRRAAQALPRVYEDGKDAAAREAMSLASLFGGLALANAGLGAVHGFAAPIGGMFDAPHGAVCAALLPYVMEANIRALRARSPEADALRRYETVARLLTGRAEARAEEGAECALLMAEQLRIPRLSSYGIGPGDLDALAEKAARASSMKGNPALLTPEELRGILAAAL